MDETTARIIERITRRYDTPVTLPNGEESSIFFDCLDLNPGELARLSAQAIGHLSDDAFDFAVGIAYSGIFFAAAVAGGKNVGILQHDGALCGPRVDGRRVVVVDDVICTAQRVTRASSLIEEAGGHVIGYCCIVDRTSQSQSSIGKPIWSAYQVSLRS